MLDSVIFIDFISKHWALSNIYVGRKSDEQKIFYLIVLFFLLSNYFLEIN